MLVIRSQQRLLSPALLLDSGLQHQLATLIRVGQSLLPVLELHLLLLEQRCKLVFTRATKDIRSLGPLYALAPFSEHGRSLPFAMPTLAGLLQHQFTGP